MITRPMLAESIKDIESVKFPVLASPKLDGIRCVKVGGAALSRKFKPIPNRHIREWIENNLPDGIDGEIVTFDESGETKDFNGIQSDVMSEAGEPRFSFCAFDFVTDDLKVPFEERIANLLSVEANFLYVVPQIRCNNVEELLAFEMDCLAEGFEGVMTRDPKGEYKCGRSTLRQGWLLKLKRFVDSEAEIIGMNELMHNINDLETNELGLAKRSTKKDGLVPAGALGNFVVRDIKSGVEFEIGTGDGLTAELRKKIWDNKSKYLGKFVKYKYQAAGQKDKPRFPVWLGFRHENDM